MSKQEIGPREKALREMREARFERARAEARTARAAVPALKEKVAAIPARKPKAKKLPRKR